MDNYSLADVAAATGANNSDWGGNSAWVLIILFAMIFGWGNGGFGGTDRAATAGDVQRAVDNSAMQQEIQRTAYENMAVTKDSAYNNLSEIRDVQAAVAASAAAQSTCCCETKNMLLENRYLDAQNAANGQAQFTLRERLHELSFRRIRLRH